MKTLTVFAMVTQFVGCTQEDGPVSTVAPQGSFQLLFLEDSTINSAQALQLNIKDLQLNTTAWLTQNDIQYYDFSSHCIYLTGDKGDFFPNDPWTFPIFHPVLIDRPFVVVSNNERCYVAALYTDAHSAPARCPYMSELDVIAYPRDVMHLSQVTSGDRWWSADDVRNDGRVKDALTALDLFRGGISVSLDSVRIPENGAISTVEYVFTIANKDQGSLYVFDPDKLDTRLFHWFTIGVVFRGSAGVFWSMHKEVLQPTTDWNPAWFSEVPVDSTIQRTVRLKGYPRIPPGQYTCYFEFFNPPVERENRVMPRGRVWVGSIYSTKLDLEVN